VVGDGPERPALERLAEARGVGSRVVFAGAVSQPEVPERVAGFDLCFAGHVDTSVGAMYHSPLKLYEYAACGRPILSPANADSAALAGAGATVVTFETSEVESLRSALVACRTDRAALMAGALQAREQVVAAHAWRERAGRLLGELEKRGLLGNVAVGERQKVHGIA
jgi:glycosyltransferase involved in cell wall biosynthesis